MLARDFDGIFIDLNRIKGSKKLTCINMFLLDIFRELTERANEAGLFEDVIRELSMVSEGNEIKNRLLLEIEHVLKKHRDKMFYFFIDSLDSIPEHKMEICNILKSNLAMHKNVRIVVSSRKSNEPIPFLSIEVIGFTYEETKEYLKDFSPTDEVINSFKKPILPIYLFYLRRYLRFRGISKLTKDILNEIPTTIDDWHREIFYSFDDEKRLLLKISAMFRDLESVNIKAVSYVTGKAIPELLNEYSKLVPFVVERTYKLFHNYFEEYILNEMVPDEKSLLAEKIAEYMRMANNLRDELVFLMLSNTEGAKRRVLEIFYPVFEREFRNGNTAFAKKITRLARKIFSERGDYSGIAYIYKNLGRIAHREGKLDLAIKLYKKAIELYKLSGDAKNVGETYNLMGVSYRRKTELDKALRCHEVAIKTFEELKLPEKLAMGYTYIGRVYSRLGEIRKSLRYYRMAYETLKEIKKYDDIALIFRYAAFSLRNFLRPDMALKLLKRAYLIYKSLNFLNDMGVTKRQIAITYRGFAKFRTAIRLSEQAISILERVGNRLELAGAINNLGRIYYYMGDLDRAYRLHREALSIYTSVKDDLGIAAAYRNIGRVLLLKGSYKDALEYFKKGLAIDQKLNEINMYAHSLYNIGRTLIYMNDRKSAFEYINKAIEIFNKIDHKLGLFRTYYGCGITFFELRKLDLSINFLQNALDVIHPKLIFRKRLSSIIKKLKENKLPRDKDIYNLFFKHIAID